MYYQKSQQKILEAEAACAAGEDSRARALYREAAELQLVFVSSQPAERVRTRSVYGMSAATLFYRAGDLDEAERLAQRMLAEPWIEQGSAEKLRELLDRIARDRALSAPSAIRDRLRALGVHGPRPPRKPLFRGDARP